MQKNIRYVLGIESSCDETGVAIYDARHGLISETLFSQIDLHRCYGGVVPELAARDHASRIMILIQESLLQASLQLSDLNGIAYCAGPGLAGALLVGASAGRSLGWALSRPTIGVHHLEAHLLSVLLEAKRPQFPFIALLVSGGHTLLVHVKAIGCYRLLGETLDDAAGEAFDKTAKLLGLGYPGGPALARLATQGDTMRFQFPRPLVDQPGFDFSFSGLKTAVIRQWERIGKATNQRADIAASFERAVVDTLVIKAIRALEHTGLKQLVIAGGVSANQRLRQVLSEQLATRQATLYCPTPRLCTDNGAMIAYAGYLRLQAGQQEDLAIQIRPRWPLSSLSQVQTPVL